MSTKELILEFFPEEREVIEPFFDWSLIEWYYNFLVECNERGGFFSKGDSEHILDRHLVESVYHVFAICQNLIVSRETKLCDVGTGPGLPGFLFVCLNKAPAVTLVDSQSRRLKLLQEAVAKTKTNNTVEFIFNRAEEIKQKFSLVVSRAFIPYPFSAEVVTRLVTKNGYYLPFLGQKDADVKLEADILSNNGYTLEKIIELKKISFLGRRHIKLLKKTGVPVQGYPRPWKTITKEIQKYNG